MKKRHLCAVVVAFTLVQPAIAKCGYSSIVVNGRILHLQGQTATITVTLQTPQGDFAKESEVSEGAFSLAAPFDTFASSGFFGDKCKNRPKTIHLTIRAGEKLLLDQQFRFPEGVDRDKESKFIYRLRQKIEVDAGQNVLQIGARHEFLDRNRLR
jgi:hypothetical protein